MIHLTLATSPETTKQPDGLDVPVARSSTERPCSSWIGVESSGPTGILRVSPPPP